MLNAGDMHMRNCSIGPDSVPLLKPICSLDLAAAAVSFNKACSCMQRLNHPIAHASQADLLFLQRCDIGA